MAVAFVQSISNAATGATASATLGAAPTQGNLLVAYFAQQSSNTWTTAAGWTALTVATSSDQGGLFYKIAGAGESATQSPCTTSSTARNWICLVSEYSGVDGSSTLLAESANADTAATKTSTSVTPSAGVAALAVGAAFSTAAATTFSGQAINGSTAGVTERQDAGSGSGSNQTHGCLWDATVATTSGSYSTTATASVAESGGISIALFRAAAATGTNYTSGPADSAALTDAATPVQGLDRGPADSAALTDAVDAQLVGSSSAAPGDALGLGDTASWTLDQHSAPSADATVTTDSGDQQPSDVLDLTDDAATALGVSRNPADTAGLTDAVTTHSDYEWVDSHSWVDSDPWPGPDSGGQAKSDTLGLTDAVTLIRSTHLTLADDLALTDQGEVVLGPVANKADTVGLTDAATVTRTVARSPADSLGLVDAGGLKPPPGHQPGTVALTGDGISTVALAATAAGTVLLAEAPGTVSLTGDGVSTVAVGQLALGSVALSGDGIGLATPASKELASVQIQL